MRPMQHRIRWMMDEIRNHKAAYILGGFFILAGLIAGFVSVGSGTPSFRLAVLRCFWGYQMDYSLFPFLWSIGFGGFWDGLLICFVLFGSLGFRACASWFPCIPPYGAWDGNFVFHRVSAAVSLDGSSFLILLGVHIACFLQLCAYGIENIKNV